MSTDIYSLEHASDVSRFGGKAAGLHWLQTHGFKSPPGVVISTDALTTHLDNTDACHALTQLTTSSIDTNNIELSALCQAIQLAIKTKPLSADFMDGLRSSLASVSDDLDNTTWVVRSSAVAEDGLDQSFAGQFESVLNVRSDAALETAIRQVWASAYRANAWRYGLQRGVLPSQMAVVVQQQVDAAFSGVLFTCDPASNDCHAMRVEYCAGLSDALVSGLITPTSKAIARDAVRQITVEPFAPESTSLLDQQFNAVCTELMATALQLESAAGTPLDIEWCVTGEQQLYLVQCRPITGLDSHATEHWTNANIGENYPGPVVPLLASFVPRGYAAYFRGLGTAIGVSQERMQAGEHSLERLVGLQAGRLYYNLSQIVTVLHAIPGGTWLARAFNTFTGTTGSPEPNTRSWSRLSQWRQGMIVLMRLPFLARRLKRDIKRFENVVDDYAKRANPNHLVTLSSTELSCLLEEFMCIRLQRWTPAALADAAAMVSYTSLQQLLNRWMPAANQAQLHNALLQGLPSIITTAPVEALWRLAINVRDKPALSAFMQSNSASEIWHRLPQDAPDFHAEFVQYLDTWGFRYSGELMLTQPTPAENPLPVIQLLKTYLANADDGPVERSAQSADARVAATHTIEAQLTSIAWLRASPLPTRARLFRWVLQATQASICLRERARMKQALLYTRLRHVCLALGDRLVAQQVLSDRESVFFLSIDEAIAVSKQCDTPASQHVLIEQRRKEFERCTRLQPPEQMQLPVNQAWAPEPMQTETLYDADDDMTGLGACIGTVTGQASVVLDVTDIETVAKDTVLVTRQTDPGWAPVFFLIKGLVVERGGMLSHGAIIAREYGIPAVVGVECATSRIRCGDRLRVDGNQGRVTWVP